MDTNKTDNANLFKEDVKTKIRTYTIQELFDIYVDQNIPRLFGFLFEFLYSIIFLWGKEIVFKLYQLYRIDAVLCQELMSLWQIYIILFYLFNVWSPLYTGWPAQRLYEIFAFFWSHLSCPAICRNWVFVTNSNFQIPVSLQPLIFQT